ncbi:MAG: hypothetical protein MZV63_58770 [Marinilabiliales bacterium]|nr:hypothetical protein [Marinilabiliales bacterium]
MNKTQQRRDEYATYKGVRVIDLLSAAKVDLAGVTGITVFAPDGYSTDHSLQDVAAPFPQGFYYDAPLVFGDDEKALLEKPESVPPGVANGHRIPGPLWLILAYEREGGPWNLPLTRRRPAGSPARVRTGWSSPSGKSWGTAGGPAGRTGPSTPRPTTTAGTIPTGSTTTPARVPAGPASSGSIRCPRDSRSTTGRTAGRSSASGRS